MLSSILAYSKRTILAVVVLAVIGIGMFTCYYTVDEGERALVLTFGNVSHVSDPGLHFKIPFIQTIRYFSVRVRKATFDNMNAYSYDQQIVENYKISVTWSYDINKIDEVYRQFGSDTNDLNSGVFSTVVAPRIQEQSKVIFGRFTAATAIQEREKLNSALSDVITKSLAEYPITIHGIQLEGIDFSETYERIVEETALAKQAIEKQKNELNRVDLEAQQKVKQAESESKAIKLKAEADAYQIEVMAKAEAEAIKLRGDALKQNPKLVELMIAEKWNGTVPNILVTGENGNGGNVLPLLNINEGK